MRTVADLQSKYPALRQECTGGNCTALTLNLESGAYILITRADGEPLAPAATDRHAILGVYDREGDQISGADGAICITSIEAMLAVLVQP